MDSLERRLVFLSIALLLVAFMVWVSGGGHFSSPTAQASAAIPNCVPLPDGGCYNLTYYGADLGTGMKKATGVDYTNRFTRPSNAPWPQRKTNYCFLADTQALSNYEEWSNGSSIRYPTQSGQDSILTDMNDGVIPSGGSSNYGFTKANISADFGGDPRAQAWGAYIETPAYRYYHQYIYHNGVDGASFGLAKGVAAFHSYGGNSPEIAIVDTALHSVVVAGEWSYGNPVSVSDAAITSFAVYNSWDVQSWGPYINGAYYEQVSYSNWTTGVSSLPSGQHYWWAHTYGDSSDPDPNVGMYKPNSTYPHHWWTFYVSIQRDDDSSDSAEYCHDENGHVMQHP
jgi:hypothetical protein